MRFSVIIPTYNRAKCVGFAIESALRQSPSPFEVIVVATAPSMTRSLSSVALVKASRTYIRAIEVSVQRAIAAFVLPKALKDLNYDQTRDIRFDPDHALWRADKLPFEIQFFHLGGYFDQPVRVHEIVGGTVPAFQ